jgi:hypothetical protein
MKQLWVKVGVTESGPFDSNQLNKLIEKKKLKSTHLVSPDREQWIPAAQVKGLRFPLTSIEDEGTASGLHEEVETGTYGFMNVEFPRPKRGRGRVRCADLCE